MCANGCVKTDAKSRLFRFEAMSLRTHTLHCASLFRVSYSLSVAISTAVALPAVLLVLCLVFQLMAQSTFDERLVHFTEHCVHVIACMQQSRRVGLSNSTHMPIVKHPFKSFHSNREAQSCVTRHSGNERKLFLSDVSHIVQSCVARHSGNERHKLLSNVSHIAQSRVTRHLGNVRNRFSE